VAASPVDVTLAGLREINGFVLGCLIDATTGMILGSVQATEDARVPVAAAGAADLLNVLSLMTGELALDGDLEDVIVTLSSHYHLLRLLTPGPGGQRALLVTLDRSQTNLAMAHREIREITATLA
jgi:hypothetical protein